MDGQHVDAVAQRVVGARQLSERLADELGVAHHHVQRVHHELHAGLALELVAQRGGGVDDSVAPTHHQHDVAGRQRGARRRVDQLAAALEALDRDAGMGDLERRQGGAGRRRADAVEPADDFGHGDALAGAEHQCAFQARRFGLQRVVADLAPHEARQHVDAHDDRAQRAEDVGDGVADGHVGLQLLQLGRRQAQARQRVARRADDGRLRQPASGKPRGQALVELEQLGHDQHRDQPRQRHEGRQDDLADRGAAQRLEELRAAFEADGVDEQRGQDRLDTVVDRHAQQAEQHRHQQRSGDAAELEFAEMDLADPVPDGQREKYQNLR